MIKDTFGQYGLGFQTPDFSGLTGFGKAYTNRVKRDELIDLARKKRFQDKYGKDYVMSEYAPEKLTEGDLTTAPVDPYFDKMFSISGSQTQTDKGSLDFGDIAMVGDSYDPIAANMYMDQLDRFADYTEVRPDIQKRVDELKQKSQDIESARQSGFIDDATANTQRAQIDAEIAKLSYMPASNAATLEEEYQKELEMYEAAKAAGFKPGVAVGDQTFGQLAEVETIGADEAVAMRELGYQTDSDTASLREQRYAKRGAVGKKLRPIEQKLIAHYNGSVPLDEDELARTITEFNSLVSEYESTGTKYGGTATQFNLMNAVDKEIKEDVQENRESSKFKTSAKKEATKYVDDQIKKFTDARKNMSKNFNQVINNADMFEKTYNAGKINNTAYQILLKAINKMIEPTSAVMQGEADAFVGATQIEELKRELVSVGKTFQTAVKKGEKGTGYTKADFNELGQIYNALLPTVKSLRNEIKSPSSTENYINSAILQAKEQYGDSLSDEELNSLLDVNRFKKAAGGQLFSRKFNAKPVSVIGGSPVVTVPEDKAKKQGNRRKRKASW